MMKYLLVLSCAALLAGCHISDRAAAGPPAFGEAELVSQKTEAELPPPDGRLLVFDAYLLLRVKNADSAAVQLPALGKKHGGYLLESSLHQVRLRVPAERLDAALAAIAQLGKVEAKNVTAQDVTDHHADLNLRLDNARRARQRYLDLLGRAERVSDVLLIEKELERLQLQIETLQGQLNGLDQRIAFSTITVSLRERVRPGPLGWVFVGLGRAVKWLFVRG